MYTRYCLSNGKRKPRRFSLIRYTFANGLNGLAHLCLEPTNCFGVSLAVFLLCNAIINKLCIPGIAQYKKNHFRTFFLFVFSKFKM